MDIRGKKQPNLSADPKSEYKEAHGTMVMYSDIIFSVSRLDTLSVCVQVVSLSGLCPVRVMSLSWSGWENHGEPGNQVPTKS